MRYEDRPPCTCPHKEGPMGMLYGVNMGRGMLRTSTDPDCPEHNEHHHLGDGEDCAHCGAPRVAWIHPETRREGLS